MLALTQLTSLTNHNVPEQHTAGTSLAHPSLVGFPADLFAKVICGTPVQSYRDKPKASIRFCLSTKATIFFAIVRANIFPPAADQDEFTTTFLPRLRVLCNVEQGPDFAAIVHDRFNAMVRDHVVAWAGRRGVWVQGPDGGYAWNQEVVDEHFGSVETIRVWLRASGILEPWEHMDLGKFAGATLTPSYWSEPDMIRSEFQAYASGRQILSAQRLVTAPQ